MLPQERDRDHDARHGERLLPVGIQGGALPLARHPGLPRAVRGLLRRARILEPGHGRRGPVDAVRVRSE